MTDAQKKDLAEEFMEMVPELAENFDDGTIPKEDLLQEGYVGLMEGINALSDDPDSFYGFSMEDQIKDAIISAMQRAIDEKKELNIRDDRLIVQVELLQKSIDRLTEELGTKPNIDEIANDMGIQQDKVIDILKLAGEDYGEEPLPEPGKAKTSSYETFAVKKSEDDGE